MVHKYDKYLDFAIRFSTERGLDLVGPPLSEAGIEDLRQRARSKLSAEIPDQYLEFLRRMDGIEWNGLDVFAGTERDENVFPEEFVDYNLVMRNHEDDYNYLIFAYSDISQFVLNLAESQFQTIGLGTYDVVEVHESFDDMLAAAFEEYKVDGM
jgi:hypothetical protein